MLSRILSRTQFRLISLSISNSYPNCSTQIPKYPFYRHFSSNNNDGYDPNHPAANIWKISEPTDDLDDIFGSSGGTKKTGPFESEKPNTNPADGAWGFGKSEAAEVLRSTGAESEMPKPKTNSSPAEGLWVLRENDVGEDLWAKEGVGEGRGVSSEGAAEVLWSTGAESEMPKPKTNTSPAEGTWALGENDVREDLWATEGVGEGRVVSSEGAGFKQWNLAEEEEGKEQKEKELLKELLEIDDIVVEEEDEKTREEREMREAAEKAELEKEKQSLLEVIQGPNRAFGDLIAASGITDDMLDSLIALQNFQDIEGLPPLSQIEDERYLKTIQKSSRHEMELQKQEDAAKARVRKVDEQGRAYGTGKRKTSIARVWIQPGEGKFIINDKEIDVYFPILDHRATILRPFSETKTLGLWDVRCTVKGGGTTGQTGALRLGISRALQNWEPGFRPPLKEAGFLTRDPRIVERKKPGKAKARKSFQWVKR